MESGIGLYGVTRDIGLFGCFVETATPLCRGRVVTLTIKHNNQTVAAAGEVAYAVHDGIGIAFGPFEPSEYDVLKGWFMQELQGSQPIEFANA